MKNKIYEMLNRISLKRKNLAITVLGAILPIFILLCVFSYQLYVQLELRQDAMMDTAISRVEDDVSDAFNSSQKLVLSYLSDDELSSLLSTSGDDQEDKLNSIKNIENKIEMDVFSNKYISAIEIYHNNESLNYESDKFRPLEEVPKAIWYSESGFNPRYLSLIPEVTQGEARLHIIKSLNKTDIYSDNIIHLVIGGRQLKDLLTDETLEAFHGAAYLINDQGLVVGSSRVLYKKGNNKLIHESDLDLSKDAFGQVTIDDVYMKGWKIIYTYHNSLLENFFLGQILTILIGTFLILIFIIMMTNLINRSINSRLYSLSKSMGMIREGTLEEIKEDFGKDEIAETKGYYNAMVGRIRDLVYLDMLTGLPNRNSVSKLIIDLALEGDNYCIMFLDIDDFKVINDTYGHDVGDEVIIALTKQLQEMEDDYLTVSRLGGDEFVLVALKCASREWMNRLGEKIKEKILIPISVGDKKFQLRCSIGVAGYPFDAVDGTDLMKKADMALHRAKEEGKNMVVCYDEKMAADFDEKQHFQAHIKESFNHGDFLMKYQPVVDAKSGDLKGVEALIRWTSDQYGLVSPYKLIRNSEEMGLILPLGEWIIREACLFARQLNDISQEPIKVSINISMIQLMNHEFYDRIIGLVEELKINPKIIVLEITETVLVNSIERGIQIVERLKDYGFGVAIDDFGTGYSSLKYLQSLPVSELKIDKSFIDNLDRSDFDKSLVAAVVSIAHQRHMDVVAEGVENYEQVEALRDLKVGLIQGYYFGKAETKEEIIHRLKGSGKA